MAPRRRKKKKRTRRKYRPSFTRMRAPLPTVLRTKLVYSDYQLMTPGIGATALLTLRANSIFDPLALVGGHQPRGFDQIMAMYSHFVINASRIKVTFVPTNSFASFGCNLFISQQRDAVALGNINDYLESDYTTWRSTPMTLNVPSITLTQRCNPLKFLGRKSLLNDPDLKGSAVADCPEQVVYHVGIAGIDPAQNIPQWQVQYEVEYECAFIEPLQPGQS